MVDKIKVGLFMSIIFGFAGCFLIVNDRDLSKLERRKLTGTEELTSDFLGNLDEYMMDQFPGRDDLLKLSSFVDRYVFLNNYSENVYVQDGYLIEKNYPLNDSSVQRFIKKLEYVEENYLSESRVFYAIVPDKSYFQKEMRPDFAHLKSEFNQLSEVYIDLFDLFELADYYKTDIHLKQTSYDKLVRVLSEKMDFAYRDIPYRKTVKEDFYGSTYAKVPFVEPDELTILESEYTDEAKVWHLEYGNKSVYDKGKMEYVDAYDVFLGGASALVTIENETCKTARELVIFRDSFASSLAPLLIPHYKKITLIDLRYMDIEKTLDYVNYEGADVLFMYSTLLVNNSQLLKVKMK